MNYRISQEFQHSCYKDSTGPLVLIFLFKCTVKESFLKFPLFGSYVTLLCLALFRSEWCLALSFVSSWDDCEIDKDWRGSGVSSLWILAVSQNCSHLLLISLASLSSALKQKNSPKCKVKPNFPFSRKVYLHSWDQNWVIKPSSLWFKPFFSGAIFGIKLVEGQGFPDFLKDYQEDSRDGTTNMRQGQKFF